MRRIAVVGLLLLLPSVSRAQLVSNVSLGARLVGESSSDVIGEIEFAKGADPTPAYRESIGSGLGLGAQAGYQMHRRVHLSLGLDVIRHSTERESVALSKTMFQLSSTARISVGGDVRDVQPYLTAGVALRRLQDGDAASGPWPRTESTWGDAVILGGGVQRPISETLRLDAGLQFAWSSYQYLSADGRFEKETGAKHELLPQAYAGIIYRPASPTVAPETRVARAPRAGERIRIHVGDRTAEGDVVAIMADSLILQTRRGNRFHQRSIALACIDALDASAGRRAGSGAAMSGAIRAMALGTAAYLMLQRIGESRLPDEQTRVAAFAIAPSAIVGAVLGSRGSRDLWTPRPLAWQTPSASRSEMSCPRLP